MADRQVEQLFRWLSRFGAIIREISEKLVDEKGNARKTFLAFLLILL
jgi:hypothetical protein